MAEIPMTLPQVMAQVEMSDLQGEAQRLQREREGREALKRKREQLEEKARSFSSREAATQAQLKKPTEELLPSKMDALQAEQERIRHEQAINQGCFPPPPTGPQQR